MTSAQTLRWIAVAVLFLVTTSPLAAQTVALQPSVIVTQGGASVMRVPDRARVSISVDAFDGKAAEAKRLAAMQMNLVLGAIKALGIPADAVKTTDFSLQTQSEYDGYRTRAKDYSVRNTIDVRIDNLDQVSDVIDAVGSLKTSGSKSVAITGVRFELKNQDSVAQAALDLAVKDAMTRARTIATAGGQALGPILRIEEVRERLTDPFFKITTRSGTNSTTSVDTPIEPNEIETKAMVTLTMAIR